jgi:hypothetical protein
VTDAPHGETRAAIRSATSLGFTVTDERNAAQRVHDALARRGPAPSPPKRGRERNTGASTEPYNVRRPSVNQPADIEQMLAALCNFPDIAPMQADQPASPQPSQVISIGSGNFEMLPSKNCTTKPRRSWYFNG